MDIGVITAGVNAIIDVVTNEKLQKTFLGTYDDGSIRSVPDAVNNVTKSPKAREKKKKKRKKLKDDFSVM